MDAVAVRKGGLKLIGALLSGAAHNDALITSSLLRALQAAANVDPSADVRKLAETLLLAAEPTY